MYLRKRSVFFAAIMVCTALFVTSCKKDSTSKDSDVESAQDNALAEANFNDVTTITDQAALGGTVNMRLEAGADANREDGSLGSACAKTSFDTSGTTKTITIDFGTANCLCNDGRNRRGKIIAAFTGKYRDAGTIVTISFSNYYVNDNQVTGSKKITNNGLNSAGHPVYTIDVNGSIVKANGAGTITWISTRQREWIAGFSTPLNLLDDTYSITGNASGTTAKGVSYSITITKALVRKMTCRWFESGTLEVTPSNKPTRTLDYGSTGCDANATVTILGYSFPIVLN